MAAASAVLPGPGPRSLLQFLRLVGQLKRVPRTGWVYRNVEKPESVSDHMYRMAVMALVTRDNGLNKDRCVRLALVHDMAECIVGDIAPADNIPKEEKHRREEKAMKQLTQLLPEDLKKELCELWEDGIVEPMLPGRLSPLNVMSHVEGRAMLSLAELGLKRERPHLSNNRGPPEVTLRHACPEGENEDHEYETQSSPEARFVKQLDQCEMILQASEYEDLENKPGRLQDFYDSTAGKFSHPEILQLVSELEAERNAKRATVPSEPGS